MEIGECKSQISSDFQQPIMMGREKLHGFDRSGFLDFREAIWSKALIVIIATSLAGLSLVPKVEKKIVFVSRTQEEKKPYVSMKIYRKFRVLTGTATPFPMSILHNLLTTNELCNVSC